MGIIITIVSDDDTGEPVQYHFETGTDAIAVMTFCVLHGKRLDPPTPAQIEGTALAQAILKRYRDKAKDTLPRATCPTCFSYLRDERREWRGEQCVDGWHEG